MPLPDCLTEEEPDAQQVVQLIEDAGQRAVTMPGSGAADAGR
ncbi:hypothetical protein ACLQ3H_17905 [Micromonospora saelicesensis]|nr:hypothetical protein [Micromonospora saelicesensis]